MSVYVYGLLRALLKNQIITKEIFRSHSSSSSSTGVLYGLPNMHKKGNPVRPILSVLGTLNYNIAKSSPLTKMR